MKILFVSLISLIFLASCAEFSEEAERRLDELRDKTHSLDSLINETTTKFDSIRNERTRVLEELFN
jgi:hypothetical protein